MSRRPAMPACLKGKPHYQAQVNAALAEDSARTASTVAQVKREELKKYRNVPVEVDGEKFDSKWERECYLRLCAAYGKARVLRQVSIPLATGLRARVDFAVVLGEVFVADQAVEDVLGGPAMATTLLFLDAKGVETDTSRAKRLVLRDQLGIEVHLIMKPRGRRGGRK